MIIDQTSLAPADCDRCDRTSLRDGLVDLREQDVEHGVVIPRSGRRLALLCPTCRRELDEWLRSDRR